jgi:hypothetical protein
MKMGLEEPSAQDRLYVLPRPVVQRTGPVPVPRTRLVGGDGFEPPTLSV